MEIMTYSLLLIKETGKERGNVCCDVRKKKIGRFYCTLGKNNGCSLLDSEIM